MDRRRTLVSGCAALILVAGLAAVPSGYAGDQTSEMPSEISVNPKLSTELFALARGLAADSPSRPGRTQAEAEPGVKVLILTDPADAGRVRAEVERVGGTFDLSSRDMVVAHVPTAELERLASAPSVRFIRRPAAPVLSAITSEGVATIGATPWHAAGRKGAGVKVAILDVGFSGYSSLMGTELPRIPSNHVKSFAGDITGGGEGHGTAVAEIVYDVAPEAEMYLVNASNEAELDQAVDWLIAQDVDVINTSWGYPCGGPVNGTGRINEWVERAAAAGITWVASAGNYAQRHWSERFRDTDGDGYHNFSATENSNPVSMNYGDEMKVCVEWDDWTQRTEDYNLYLLSTTGSVLTSSRDVQNGPSGPEPNESFEFSAGGTGDYHVAIKAYRTSRDSVMHLYVYPPGTECAMATAAAAVPDGGGVLGEIRAFRDHVLATSGFGRELTHAYYAHSGEVRRILLSHPSLAIEAAKLIRESRPAVRALLSSGGSGEDEVLLSQDLVQRVDAFLRRLEEMGSSSLRTELLAFRERLNLPFAAGRSAEQFWQAVATPSNVRPPVRDIAASRAAPSGAYPAAGYMRYVTSATSIIPPGDSPHALTAGAAAWSTGDVREFSSEGPTADGRIKPDLVAPDGVCTSSFGECSSGGFTGTSAAAAHTTGAAVLARQVNAGATPADIRAFLIGRAVDAPPSGPDDRSGAGHLALGSPGGLGVPVPEKPIGVDVLLWPTFAWSSVQGADSYRLMVAFAGESLPRDPNAQTCERCLINTTTSVPVFTAPGYFFALMSYRWQVQARSAAMNGPWSEPAEFRTANWGELIPRDRFDLLENTGAWPAAGRNAVAITHGWDGNAEGWVLEMGRAVCGRLQATSRSSAVAANTLTKVCQAKDWDVWVLDWRRKADTAPWNPSGAAANGRSIGEMLASNFALKKYTKLHLIAHSAGSNLIDGATERLAQRTPGTVIHDTFLDAYQPQGDATLYGQAATVVDNYVDTRIVGFEKLDGTRMFLEHGYNVDVTPAAGDPCTSFFDPREWSKCRHSRPVRFYGTTIDPGFVGDMDHHDFDPIAANPPLGFQLSLENGASLEELTQKFRPNDCTPLYVTACGGTSPGAFRESLVAVAGRTVKTVAGAVLLSGPLPSLLYQSIKLGVALVPRSESIGAAAVEGSGSEDPSLVAVEVTTQEPVNTLRFHWSFASGGQGLLSVFVDGMLVRELDQRHVAAASTRLEAVYVGGPAGVLAPGTHRIAFRLDGFGSKPSGVELTDVALVRNSPISDHRRAVRH